MTIGLDLTDDNGRLRPEVARAIRNVPDGPLPHARDVGWPEAVGEPAPAAQPVTQPISAPQPPADIPAPAALRPVEPRFVPPVPNIPPAPPIEIRIPVPRMLAASVPFAVVLACAGLVAMLGWYAGAHFGTGLTSRASAVRSIAAKSREVTAAGAVPGEVAPRGIISGVNVNLRSGPGLGFPVIARLLDGDMIVLGEERKGWYSVTTAAGGSGYVFGAFIRDAPLGDQSPGRVTHRLVSDGSPQVVLHAGEKVLLTREATGQYLVTLPTGRQLRVSPNDVDPLD